jgi:digeranylgeranylglycerophospholipid reductase
MKTDFDLVIVGGSFAGLVCARTAAMRGLRVAVMDRKRDPGAQVRTTGILVKEAADALDLPSGVTRKVRGVRIYAPSGRYRDLQSDGYYFLATDTPALLRWLALDASMAGARLLYGARWQGACYEQGRLRLRGPDITTRYLIGADGARSQVARSFRLGLNKRVLTGSEIHVPALDGLDRGHLHCFFGREKAPGYIGWAVPGLGCTQIGIATKSDYRPDLGPVLRQIEALTGEQHLDLTERRGGLIPVGGPVRPFATDRVLLIGDAAGLVSPLTGGGIHNAFLYGRRAAQVVSDYLQDRGPEPSQILARETPSYVLKSAMRRVMDVGAPDWLIERMLDTPMMGALAESIFFRPRSVVLPNVRPAFQPAVAARAMGAVSTP